MMKLVMVISARPGQRTGQRKLVHNLSCRGVSRIDFGSLKMSGGPGLESLVDQTISVITNDGRNIVGVLKGFDQATNIILDESHERVYSTKEGVQQLVLGLYIIRGDNISVVGELDEELDAHLDLSKLRAQPLKPVIH
uniref:U6 snRNA-associated Sm-like protein LSm8 n=2 Tax=Quercus lobata TaxID=97700 RepID=A0A7N2MRI1_QUELO